MFNSDLDLIDEIPISESITIVGLEFTTYPSSYYNEYKPILLITNLGNEITRIKLETNDSWSQEFPKLFEKAINLKTNQQN